MRRYLFAFVTLAAIGAAAAVLYAAYATDREYARLITEGDQAARADRPFEALEAYSGAIALRPDSMLAHLKRGRLYRDRGELAASAKDLRRAVALDPTATLPLEVLADTFLSMERFDRAAERYRAYLSLDDRSAPVWYKLGLAYYRGGERANAMMALRRAIALDGQIGEAHLLLGLCLRDEGNGAGAREALEAAARLSPALTAPREALATVYAERGDLLRSIDQLEALAALDSASPERFVALGMAHAHARRYEAAVLTLSRAVERFPDNPDVYGALGRVWLEAAEVRPDAIALNKAIEALSTAATHTAVSSPTLTDLGRALLMTNDLVAAERVLRQAVDKRPVQPDAYLHLATVTARSGRTRDARDALIRYATLAGDTQPLAHVATRIAEYSIQLRDAPLALHWIDKAVDETGETPQLADLRRRALSFTN